MDRFHGALWVISQNKDIIEANTNVNFAQVSSNGGATWTQGNIHDLCYGMYNQNEAGGVIAMYKPNAAGNQVLILVYDGYNNPLQEKIVKVKIGSIVKDIKIFGNNTTTIKTNI